MTASRAGRDAFARTTYTLDTVEDTCHLTLPCPAENSWPILRCDCLDHGALPRRHHRRRAVDMKFRFHNLSHICSALKAANAVYINADRKKKEEE